jgi:predicted nucleic acid-binding protein
VARAEVPDTGVFIHAMRDPTAWSPFEQALVSGRTWLSSVVVAELYAGTRSREDARLVDRIAAAMQRTGRLLTPTREEWAHAGRLMARRIRLQGALSPRDHLADVLILVSGARVHGAIVTANVRHFAPWARLAARAGLDVVVTAYQP